MIYRKPGGLDKLYDCVRFADGSVGGSVVVILENGSTWQAVLRTVR